MMATENPSSGVFCLLKAAGWALLVFLCLVAAIVGARTELAGQAPVPSSSAPRTFIEKNCVGCHNDTARTGGLSLSAVDMDKPGEHSEVLEKVLHKIRTGQMPPSSRPRPEVGSAKAMVAWLETALDRAADASPHPGRVGVHRLNRTEYANAIRDLLALDIDTKSMLLPDEADEGFDNIAASLALSPSHLERYLAAAREISRRAVGDPGLGAAPTSVLYPVRKMLEQDIRTSEELPFGSRGGLVVRHNFPLDGEYEFKVRLRRQVYDYIIGMGTAQKLDVRIDGKLIRRFTVGGDAKGILGPLTWNGEIVGDTEYELYMHAADAGLVVRVPVQAGTRKVTVAFVDSPWQAEGVEQPRQTDFGRGSDEYYDGYAAVDAVAIRGPYQPGGAGETASRREIFVCRPKGPSDEDSCARKIVSRLARRAYRRPVADADIQTLITFYKDGKKEGGFETGIQSAIERLLVSFNFLFRIEGDAPANAGSAAYRVSDIDLASRLSFFLWNSIPDDDLLDIAIRGKLKEPAVLEQQVRRMLRDGRSRSLVESFANQWLTVRKLNTWQPDQILFPDWDENLRDGFIKETELFLDSQLREDRSVVDLITANYSFVNERLAKHYGVPNIYGERFQRVTFSDGIRGGLLGQGGILMVTSYPDRTAPVVRGFWVLENLLGMPPPPPPPNVPDLAAVNADGRKRTLREQMELHRQNPACATCHVRMDPLGFALENFDAIGRWRTTSDNVPIDASAVFADGTPISGVQGLRQFLLSHREDYVTTFTSRLLTYALGRSVESFDNPAIRRITRDAAASDYRWSSLILGVVKSMPFQYTNGLRAPARQGTAAQR
jgi:mono/diheme cytochrome c family protein